MALSNPRWSVGVRYQELGTSTYKTRTLSGVNFDVQEVNPEATGSTGYSATQVNDFARLYASIGNNTYYKTTLTAQYDDD